MTDLDSRKLGFADMFGQKFSRPGIVAYRLVRAGADVLALDLEYREYAIDVAETQGDGISQQHHVNVLYVDGELVADPAELKISAGDFVTWHSPDGTTPPYIVDGVGPTGAFGSANMADQTVYTHAFGLPGVYRWVDGNGSALSGEVEVYDARPRTRAESRKWVESIATAPLVHIQDGTVVAGRRVSVAVGGTVCWAVESAPSVAITDSRLAEPYIRPADAKSSLVADQTNVGDSGVVAVTLAHNR